MNSLTNYRHNSIVQDYYRDSTITIKQVAELNGVSMHTVKYHIAKSGKGPKERVNPGKPILPIRDEVVEYFMANMDEPLQAIADRFGVAKFTVSNWVSRYLKFLTS